MKLALKFLFLFLLTSPLFGNETSSKELLKGLLDKDNDKSQKASSLLIDYLENGIKPEEAISIIIFLAENASKIKSENISEIFHSFHHADQTLNNDLFFDCLFSNYHKFKKDAQVSIFHLTLQKDDDNSEKQFKRFLDAYGKDLLYLNKELIELCIIDPLNISTNLYKALLNENIKGSIYQYFLNLLQENKINSTDLRELSQYLTTDIYSALETLKEDPKRKKDKLIFYFKLALALNTELNESIITKVYSTKDEDIFLSLIEVLYKQGKLAPKNMLIKILKSDLFRFYLFRLIEKYQINTELITKRVSQEEIGRGQLMCWFYEFMQVEIPADKIQFNGFHKIDSDPSRSIALFKCFIELPYVKEIEPIAASGGIFSDEKDLSYLARESVGTNYIPWIGQSIAKHAQNLASGFSLDADSPFNPSTTGTTESELNQTSEVLSNLSFGQLFFIGFRSALEEIYTTRGIILEEEENIFEIIFTDKGRISAKIPVIKKGSQYLRTGVFHATYDDKDINVIGQFDQDFLNGEIKIIDGDSNSLFNAILDHNKLKSLQLFENNKLKAKFSFSNQVFNGPFIIFNETNQIIFECNYKDGKKNGVAIDYYDNGKIKKTVSFKNGYFNSDLIKYDEDGVITLKIEFDKHRSGPISMYYPNGQIKIHGYLKNILFQGPVLEYYSTGQLKSSSNYKDSLPDGILKTYFEDGQLKSKTIYSNGLRQGEEIHYHENGKIRIKTKFINNLIEGEFFLYNIDGNIQCIIMAKNNLAHGKGIEYNKKGEIISQTIFEKGEIKEGTSFIENTLEMLEYKNFVLIKRYSCDKNGKILKEIELFDEKILSFLRSAINKDNVNFIKKILDSNIILLNIDLGEGQSSLHLVCSQKKESIEACDLLLELKANVNIQDNKGNTPLHYALQNNHDNLVDLILLKEPQLELENKAGLSLIEALLQNPRFEITEYINDTTYQIHLKNKRNLLHLAAEYNQSELIKQCINAGIIINAKDINGNTPLSIALLYDKKEASELLIHLGASVTIFDSACLGDFNRIKKEIISNSSMLEEVDGLGNSIFHYCIMKGNYHIFDFLINQGAKLEVKNNEGLDPISLAIIHNQPQMIAQLTSKGIEIKENFNDQKNAVTFMVKNGLESLMKKYVDKGFSLNRSTPEAPNLLFVAVANNQEKISAYLIEKGISVNEINQNNTSCFQIALNNKNKNIMKLILNSGGKVGVNEAIQYGDLELLKKSFKEFKENGGSTYKQNFLHCAIESENIDAAKFLLENRLGENVKNEMGFTPLYLSLKLKNEKMAELLISNGAKIFDKYNDMKPEIWRLASDNGFTNILLNIIKNEFELNSPTGHEMLEDFVEKGYHELVEQFLKNQNFIYPEYFRLQLLSIAKSSKDEKMIKILNSKPTTSLLESTTDYDRKDFFETKPGNKKVKHGKFKTFNSAGELAMSGNYQNNLLEGSVYELIPGNYFTSKYSISNYKHGVLEGLKTTYYNANNKDFSQILSQEYYSNGALTGICSYFEVPNIKVMEITYLNGAKNGKFKEWTNDQYLVSDLEFKSDKLWSGFAILKENQDLKDIQFSFDGRRQLSNLRKAIKWEFNNGEVIKKEMILLPKTNANVVDSGLDWLSKTQEDGGFWDPGKYEGKTTDQSKVMSTAICLLTFLGAGNTDRIGKYKKIVKQAVIWLISVQRDDGSFTNNNQVNGICTQALAEATGMGCGGNEVKLGAEKACKFILSQQNASGGFNDFGKSEKLEPGDYDKMPATVFCIAGLKSAQLAGIYESEIRVCFNKTDQLFNKIPTTGDMTETSQGKAWFNGGGDTTESSEGGINQAMALLIRQYLGHERTEPWSKAAAKELSLYLPKDSSSINFVQVYFQFLTLFQQGGDVFKNWNLKSTDILFQAQSDDENLFCSWPKMNTAPFADGGRVASSAFAILSLEIYYRYKCKH